MDDKTLLKKYNSLLIERDRLLIENRKLRGELKSQLTFEPMPNLSNEIAMHSPVSAKISLFRSLFKGRVDVYAKRWYSVNTGKSGYQPVCENEWDKMLCNKKIHRCSHCPNRILKVLDEDAIFSHLAGADEYGRDVIGIYPLLEDETCHLLALDFDGSHFREDTLAFLSVCEAYGIAAYIECSRSANGAHVWIFFDTPISAYKARKLGASLLTETMKQYKELPFESYDRMFPNQDVMPLGGFGNLIALPLQGKARKKGGSIFVDKKFQPIFDPWLYLSHIIKMSEEKIELILEKLCTKGDLGILSFENNERPWQVVNMKKRKNYTGKCLSIIKSNMIYIERNQLNHELENVIKRLAAFKNPEFYKMQSMRLPIYHKPRVIYLYDLEKDYLMLPRGCEDALKNQLDALDISYDISDKSNVGIEIEVSFNGKLNLEQDLAAEAMLQYNIGVLSAVTAFGKTVVAANMIATRRTNTLILVHTQALLDQWLESLDRFLLLRYEMPTQTKGRGRKKKWSPIGMIGKNKNTLTGIVDVAIMQSLVFDGEVKNLIKDYGMIIVDECHHVPAVNFERILKAAHAKYIYGLTATPTRKDGHHPIIFMQCGPIRYQVDAIEAAKKRSFEHNVLSRLIFIRHPEIRNEKQFSKIYASLAESDFRNQMIVEDVVFALKQGKTPIILTERTTHIEILAKMLEGSCDNVVKLMGSMSAKQKKQTMDILSEIKDEESMVLIATGRYIGEGFDFPRLDTLFLALPIAWKGKVIQYVGRLHRNYPNKTEVLVYDYVDVNIPVLEKMYHKRVTAYKQLGYRIKMSNDKAGFDSLLYTSEDFLEVYRQDIESAIAEVVVVSPFMSIHRIKKMLPILKEAVQRKILVEVVTRPVQAYRAEDHLKIESCINLLNQAGIRFKFLENFHQKYTTIDKKIIWYGSINFLSYGRSQESVMRIKNLDVAGELLNSINLLMEEANNTIQ